MKDKQIIIDGCDVSGCTYYDANADKEGAFLFDCKREHAPCWSCASMPGCLYKKYKRKEQECEELKKINNHIEHNRNQKANKLMRIEKLITACSTSYTDEFIQELLVILHEPEPSSFENKYKATLVEIKEIAEPYNNMSGNCIIVNFFEDMYKILQKIRKVIPDEN